ncbi:MAG: DUF423 domain-containing protein [Methylacidiphilales bacterium]|nr:DUF423 domain-containing protein [Candidatus Methylacidiphilales bacterium]MDW8349902.1 DUF423 domain-containing protein [Verrucomicrobiae bacterium]
MTTRLAGVLGFLGVILGAWGAHGLRSHLTQLGTLHYWETAVLYHLIHAVALLTIGMQGKFRARVARVAFFLGVLIFSGSLYLLAITGWKWLGAITPIGGLMFVLGWGSLLFTRSEY